MSEQFQNFLDGINLKFNAKGRIKDVGGLFQSLKAIPGGLEMASVAILENAYIKLRSQKYTEALKNIPKGGYFLLEADQAENPNDRNLAIVRDRSGNYFVYLLVEKQRFDNTLHQNIEFEQGNDNECMIALEIGGKGLKLTAQLTSKRYFDVPESERVSEIDSNSTSVDIGSQLSEIAGFNMLPDTHTTFIMGKRIQFAPHVQHDFVKVISSPLPDEISICFNSKVDGEPAVKTISQKKLQVFLSVVEQIELLHDNGFVLRDLKPENILFKYDEETNKDKVYIIDYEEFIKLNNSQPTTSGFVGTPEYLAPETKKVLLEFATGEMREKIDKHLQTTFGGSYATVKEAASKTVTNSNDSEGMVPVDDFPVDKSIDIYALGIMLYECITSKRITYREGLERCNEDGTPMLDENQVPMVWTKKDILDKLNEDKKFIDNQPLLSKMLAENPQHRLSIAEVKQTLKAMLQEFQKLTPYAKLKTNAEIAPPVYIDALLKKLENDLSDANKNNLLNYIDNLQVISQQQIKEPSDIKWKNTNIDKLKFAAQQYIDKLTQLNNIKKAAQTTRRTSYKYKPVTVAPNLSDTVAIKEQLAELKISIEHYDRVINNLGTPDDFRNRYTRSPSSRHE